MHRTIAIDHHDRGIAKQIHAILALAQPQETALMCVDGYEPEVQSVEEIQATSRQFIGTYCGERLIGALSFEPDEEPGQYLISLLVVHADHQRRGIARNLVLTALAAIQSDRVAVVTSSTNVPALSLYHRLGFVPYRVGSIGEKLPPMIKLRWARHDPSGEVKATA